MQVCFFFFKQKTAYEMLRSLVGSEMCIRDSISNALDKVSRLQGVYYDWKGDTGGKHDIGFIAEDVGKVLPELVSWDADGENASGMDYARVNALLVEAIKEQQKEIDELKQLVADMARDKEGSK